jgi:hypothetical protein
MLVENLLILVGSNDGVQSERLQFLGLLRRARKHGDLKGILLRVTEETSEDGASDIAYHNLWMSVNARLVAETLLMKVR